MKQKINLGVISAGGIGKIISLRLGLSKHDDLVPRFYRLAIANILSSIVSSVASTLTLAFLGHLSEIRHLAAVTLVKILFDSFYQVLKFLQIGTTGVTAEAVGTDDREAMLLAGLRNGSIALVLGALILILQYPLQQLGFALLSAAQDVEASGLDYFNARIWGAPAVLLRFVLIGWFLGREMSGVVLLLFVVSYGAHIALDYLYIIRLDWASTGAGASVTACEYFSLSVGLILAMREFSGKEVLALAGKIWNWSAFKATFSLNGNLLVWYLATTSTYLIFTNLSAGMGTTILAENALLFQVVFLSFYVFEAIAYATTSLSGNLKGHAENSRFLPLLQMSVGTSLLIGLSLAAVFSVFPVTVFGLLTNHDDVIQAITAYVPWLFLVLGGASIALTLEGYFAGLEEGHTLRNVTLIGALLGFVPLAVSAWYFHSNHILWLAMSAFMAARVVMLGIQLPRTLQDSSTVVENELVS